MAAADVSATARTYLVFRGDVCALEIAGRPGTLRSMAAPPPGFQPPTHPFVDATSHNPATEHATREVLLASRSFEDFLTRLVEAGFDLASGHTDRWDVEEAPRRIVRAGQAVGAVWPQAGQFSSLWWQPAPDEAVYPHALVTSYDRALTDTLHGMVAATRSLDALEAALEGLDLKLV